MLLIFLFYVWIKVPIIFSLLFGFSVSFLFLSTGVCDPLPSSSSSSSSSPNPTILVFRALVAVRTRVNWTILHDQKPKMTYNNVLSQRTVISYKNVQKIKDSYGNLLIQLQHSNQIKVLFKWHTVTKLPFDIVGKCQDSRNWVEPQGENLSN